MADPVISNDPNNPAPTTPPAPGATPPANGSQNTDPTTDFDSTTLSDEQFAKIYKDPRLYNSGRFKELAEAKQERDRLKAEQKKNEETALIEQNKFKELAEKRDAENKELRSQVTQTRIDSTIERAAVKAGIIDLDAALKLIDQKGISVDEATSEIKGIDEAVAELVKARPYLANRGTNASLGNPTNPGAADTGVKRFTKSQINDPVFYRKNEADIQAAMRAGNIDMSS